jgi:hypothetical protein
MEGMMLHTKTTAHKSQSAASSAKSSFITQSSTALQSLSGEHDASTFSMNRINPRSLTEQEIIHLAEQGKEFICPICSTRLVTNPSSWQSGEKLKGLVCPNRHNHFLAYGDEQENLQAFCNWIGQQDLVE